MRAAPACLAILAAGMAQAGDVASARYSAPTDRYGHDILGADGEWTILTVRLQDGRQAAIRWDAPIVFEDTAPRVVDLDGDGTDEIVTVESHADFGARLAVWGVAAGRLVVRARTPFIGQRHRWLAPAGWGDLDGDGAGEIAYVDRPHLAKVLKVWRYRAEGGTATLTQVAELAGVTNHRIGDARITGGLRRCSGVPELVMLDADWREIVSVRLAPEVSVRSLGAYRGPDSVAAALACR